MQTVTRAEAESRLIKKLSAKQKADILELARAIKKSEVRKIFVRYEEQSAWVRIKN